MKAISKLFNIIISIIIAVQLALLAYVTVFTYNLGQVASDKSNLKTWLTDEVVKEAYIDYLVDSYYSLVENPLTELIEDLGIVDETNIREALEQELVGSKFDDIVDSTVDGVYDWLEGRSESLQVETSDEILEDLSFVDDALGDEMGILSEIISPTEILKISDQLNIIDLEQLSKNNIPYLYQQLLTLPKKLLIVCAVLAVLLILSNKSWRYGIFMIGLSLTLMPLYTLFLYKYFPLETIVNTQEIAERMELPALDQIPEFLVLIYQKAGEQVMDLTNKHALYMLIVGVVLVVISQLAIKDKVVEEDEKTATIETAL
jgi:hypothetical protein